MIVQPESLGNYFEAGGTLSSKSPSYVKRPADQELYDAIVKGEFCYVLTPRQMGKSSLMIRTARRLENDGFRTSVVDLTQIGTPADEEKWYLSLLSQIARNLNLSMQLVDQKMDGYAGSNVQFFIDFFQDVILKKIEQRIVIFIDEIDTTLKLKYRDDFFAGIRSLYNARALNPDVNRITFVLLGVAAPSDLVNDQLRTPFNVGFGLTLQELDRSDAIPLERGLEIAHPGKGEAILSRIFYWTNGHPYLTQKICYEIVESGNVTWDDKSIDNLMEKTFLSEQSRKETNLKFVQDRILSHPQSDQMLKLYKKALGGKRVPDDTKSSLQNQLKLSGLVKADNGFLIVRNRLYEKVFDATWIKRNYPKESNKKIIIGLTFLLFLVMGGLLLHDSFWTNRQLAEYSQNFYQAEDSKTRLQALSHIFDLHGILTNNQDYYDLVAQQLFFSLSEKEQIDLFSQQYGPGDFRALYTVIIGLYTTFADVSDTGKSDTLLDAMQKALSPLDTKEAKLTKSEILFWLDARSEYKKGEKEQAISKYTLAIDQNDQNPATFYERARAYIALPQFESAASDMEQVVALVRSRASKDQTFLSSAQEYGLTSVPITFPAQELATQTNVSPPVETPSSPTLSPLIVQVIPTALNDKEVSANEGSLPTSPGVNSKFSTFSDIAVAVRTLFEANPKLQAVVIKSPDQYPNLVSIGILAVKSNKVCDWAEFVADVTVPDGTVMEPGTTFQKIWRVKNIGSCPWTTDYSLVFVSGSALGGESPIKLPKAVNPGEIVDLAVEMTAPSKPGNYRSYWQLENASGTLFGIGSSANDPWWTQIRVLGDASSDVVYDFTGMAAYAKWSSGAGGLDFPGTQDDPEGYGMIIEQPKYEGGVVLEDPALLMVPQQITNGFIQAEFPAVRIHGRDRFQATIGCEDGATNCYIQYRINYKIDGDPAVRTFWAWREKYDGPTYKTDMDLSPLANQNVTFILNVNADGSPVGDRALWGNPIIVRSNGASSIPSPAGMGTAPPPTPTIRPSACDRVQFIADVSVPDGTVISPNSLFAWTFRVKNVGQCTWTPNYQLVFVSGEKMSGPDSLALPFSVEPGETVDMTVRLISPPTPGSYRGYWMFKNESGELFGLGAQGNKPTWVDIRVPNETPSPVTFTPTP